MNPIADRKRFEAWAEEPPREWSLERQGRAGCWPGQYRSYSAQAAWEGWQEALRIEREKPMPASILSDRVRAGVEAAPWVVDEIRRMEAWMDAAKHALHQISLCSQNSTSSQRECGRIARAALTPSAENSSTSPAGHAATQTASDPP